jgi:hypothetical protein
MKKILRYWLYASLGLGAVGLLVVGGAYVYNQTLTPEERAEATKRYEQEQAAQAKQADASARTNTSSDLGTHATEAYLVAKEFVKKRLSFPDEADFPWTPTSSRHKAGDIYEVLGEVTAKNAYGVESTHRWKALLQYQSGDDLDPQNWQEISVEVNK